MKNSIRLGGALLLVASLMGACGLTTGGDQGSESHWLSSCETNDDCPSGECICGVCTARCESFMDCPFPLDRCTPSGEEFQNGCVAPADSGLCGASSPERTKLSRVSQSLVASCDGERTSELHLVKNLAGHSDAIALGDDGFAVFSSDSAYWGLEEMPSRVTFVDSAGQVVQEQPFPSAKLRWLSDVVQADGAFVLSGAADGVDGHTGWVGKVDDHWNLLWEVEVGEPGVYTTYLNQLPDGGVIASGMTWKERPSDVPPPSWAPKVFWTRIDGNGRVLWQQTEALEGLSEWSFNRLMTLTSDSQLVAVAPNGDSGTTNPQANMIRGALDGTYRTSSFDRGSMGAVTDVAALPNGRIAVASAFGSSPGATLTVIGADGKIDWEQSFVDHWSGGVKYDASRSEVIMGGSRGFGMGSSWMIATDLEGNVTWELTRDPQVNYNTQVSEISPTQGPGILGVAVSPRGEILALGATDFQLTYFVISPESCE